MNKRKITIQDLYNIKIVNDPQISPNGEQIAYSVQTIDPDQNRYLSHLFLADLGTGETRQFTQGVVQDRQPRWSPDSSRIAFCRTQDQSTQIWQIPVSGGEAQQLTLLDEGSLGTFSWSPNGKYIAFEFRLTHLDWTQEAKKKRDEKNRSNPPRIIEHFRYRQDGVGFLELHQQIWVCELESGRSTPITEGVWDARDLTWSPDGGSLAFISNRCADPDGKPYKQDIWLVSANGGPLTKIQTPEGYKWGLCWSPNGKYWAYIGSETRGDPWGTRNDQLWILDSAKGQSRSLTANLDRSVENVNITDLRGTGNQVPIWHPDSLSLYFLVSDRGNCHLYSVRLDADPEIILGGNVDITGFSLDLIGKNLAVIASKPDLPTEIFTVSTENISSRKSLNPISNANSLLLEELQLSLPEEIWFQSFDDTEIQGWLLKPPNFNPAKKYPLLLYIHGGPAAQYANTFFHEFQILAANGYIVLYTNPRGSLGREEEFATSIEGDWGNLDYQDLLSAMKFAGSLPSIDLDRTAVAGGSYGGFMVTWIVGRTDRFRCAITERGVSNRHSAIGTTDNPPMPDGYWDGNIWERPERLWQQSPLRFAGTIRTPLMIIHSEGDLRCPIGQAEQLYSALKRLKQKVTFLRYPAETSHGLSRNGPPDLRIDRLQRITNWLGQYLS